MSTYATFFEINFSHSYYTDGKFHELVVSPTSACTSLMKRFGLLFRRTDSGLVVLYNVDFWERANLIENQLKEIEGLVCEFGFHSQNVSFSNFTDLPENNLNTLIFSNKGVSGNGKLSYTIGSERQGFAIASISWSELIEEKTSSIKSAAYNISFDSRKTIWEYYVLNYSNTELRMEGDIKFGVPKPTTLENGQAALLFASRGQVPVYQTQKNKIYLNINPERFLPAPSVANIAPLTSSKSAKFSSKTYVYL